MRGTFGMRGGADLRMRVPQRNEVLENLRETRVKRRKSEKRTDGAAATREPTLAVPHLVQLQAGLVIGRREHCQKSARLMDELSGSGIAQALRWMAAGTHVGRRFGPETWPTS